MPATASPAANSAEAVRPHLRAIQVEHPPTLDGKLDEPAWLAAIPTTQFIQRRPRPGTAPDQETNFRILYDQTAIYVGFECKQPKHEVRSQQTVRDREVESDYVQVSLDTRGDGMSAFVFMVNAGGTRRDGTYSNDTTFSAEWDGDWDAQVAVGPGGWSAELRIPLSTLRFKGAATQVWGLQVRRYTSATQELVEWAYIPPTVVGEVSRYGRLTDLRNLRPKSRLEIRPMLVGRLRFQDLLPQSSPSRPRFDPTVGLDLKWHLTPQLTLDLTINPDFAQVEVDQAVLNLTKYEYDYPEKRPFFLETLDTFRTPLRLLYTRRIGRVPSLPVLPLSDSVTETPQQEPAPSPLYGAFALSGQLGHGWSIGLLSGLTQHNTLLVSQLRHDDTSPTTPVLRTVEPLTLYSALRLRREVAKNNYIGLLATGVNRFEQGALYPLNPQPSLARAAAAIADQLCPSGSVQSVGGRCYPDAYVVAVDGQWQSRQGEGDYIIRGQVAVSHLASGPLRILLDGTQTGAGDTGAGGKIEVAKLGGTHWLWTASFEGNSRTFNYNDLGYMRRANLYELFGYIEYQNTNPWHNTLESHTRIATRLQNNLDGLNLRRHFQIDTDWKFSNFWDLYLGINYLGAYFDDTEVGDGSALYRAQRVRFDFAIDTDPRKKVAATVYTQLELIEGGFRAYVESRIGMRLHKRLDVEVLPTGSFTEGEPRYIGSAPLAAPGYLLGRLTAASIGATLRATGSVAKDLTVQVYSQLFLASRHFSSPLLFRSHETRPLITLDELSEFPRDQLTANPDSQTPVLNLVAILRWEFLPGSAISLIYSRIQEPSLTLQPGEAAGVDFASLRYGPANHLLMLKLIYQIL